MPAKPRPYDRLTNPGLTPQQAAIAAALEPLDKVASETEARWGIGVLERLVSPELAAKFAANRVHLDKAIDDGDLEEVIRWAKSLAKGWKAMEADAEKAGFIDDTPTWCVEAEDGTKYCFVHHESETTWSAKRFPDHRVWAMSEVVRILQSHQLTAIHDIKGKWPGAVVTKAERKERVNLNDDLPF